MKRFQLYISIALLFALGACEKDWLDKKPDISLVVPTSLTDLQALLDNTQQSFNRGGCFLGEVGADNYYLETTGYQSLGQLVRNAYIWLPDVYDNVPTVADWSNGYIAIYYSNTVLEAINSNDAFTDLDLYNNVLGSALFYKAFAYYDMAQVFTKLFDPETADADLGLVLRNSSDINDNPARSSVMETYQEIIDNAKRASSLLPITPLYKTRPSKPSALALLARTYLSMRDYDNAFLYADSCLMFYNKLINYQELNPNSSTPLMQFNDEVIFHSSTTLIPSLFNTTNAVVDSLLYNSYDDNDIRKIIFFRIGTLDLPRIFGSYNGSSASLLFNGLATDEVYLIRAEANCRKGNYNEALLDLNHLLENRYRSNFDKIEASSQDEALDIILSERQKELIFRGLRWTDLKRLNTEEKYRKTVVRHLNGNTYTLDPGDNKYVYPIPPSETNYNPNIIQNPRN